MCVTSGEASITGTQAYTCATRDGSGQLLHVSGYQNVAETIGANCMFLNFPGRGLGLVRGPEHTTSLMQSITARLMELEYVTRMRGFSMEKGFDIRVEEYGDYTVVLAQGPGNILGTLGQVPEYRRPAETPALRAMVDFYLASFPNDSFVLACFNGTAKPKHPITVRRTAQSGSFDDSRSEEHTSELQSPDHLVCRLLLEKKKRIKHSTVVITYKDSLISKEQRSLHNACGVRLPLHNRTPAAHT